MADIHPIRDAADYEQALAEIDALIKKKPDGNTPDGERLELLSLLVSDYESKHNPIQPDDPLASSKVALAFTQCHKGNISKKDIRLR